MEDFGYANAKFVDEDYEGAINLYTSAIDQDDTNKEFYLKRAMAYIKLKKFSDAVMDTQAAIQQDPQFTKAYFRQGQAYHGLGDDKSALDSLGMAIALKINNEECEKLFEQLAQNAGVDPVDLIMNKTSELNSTSSSTVVSGSGTAPLVAAKTSLRPKHDWYQTDKYVYISVLIKKLKAEDVKVEFSDTNVNVDIKLAAAGSEYNLDVDTCHSIVPGESSFKVMSTKVEIKMVKKQSGVQWTALEGDGSDSSDKPATIMKSPEDKLPGADKQKMWDALAKQAEEDEANEKKEGDAALNDLFQKIYADADEDTRRAMNKSFQESGGTVLSTNWKEIGGKKTEVKPPEGVEHKKY